MKVGISTLESLRMQRDSSRCTVGFGSRFLKRSPAITKRWTFLSIPLPLPFLVDEGNPARGQATYTLYLLHILLGVPVDLHPGEQVRQLLERGRNRRAFRNILV